MRSWATRWEQGVTARWLVIEGDHDFFAITKRIHNRLHGAEGDEGDLEVKERTHYEEVLEENGRAHLSANCARRRRHRSTIRRRRGSHLDWSIAVRSSSGAVTSEPT